MSFEYGIRNKRLFSKNHFNCNFLDKGVNVNGKTNACRCNCFVVSKPKENFRKLKKLFLRKFKYFNKKKKKILNSTTTYSTQKSCELFQKILKIAGHLLFTLFNTIELGFSMSHNKRIIYNRWVFCAKYYNFWRFCLFSTIL